MKKLFSSLLICLFVFGLASCEITGRKDPEPHTVHVDENGDGLCDECNENLVLATPTVTIDEEGLASWNVVEHASSYVYKLNGVEMATLKTSLQLAHGDELQVKAVAQAPYSDSKYSASKKYEIPAELLVIATPTVTIDEEGLATWNTIEHAASYVYKLNGVEMATLKTSLQLADGDKLQVKAIGDAPYTDSSYSEEQTYVAPIVLHYGLPASEEGFYMRDADVLQDGNVRYLVYSTNKTKASEDTVIALRVGELTENGWLYGEEQIILEAGLDGAWDQFLGSASLVKGAFTYKGEEYQYLLAYQGTALSTNCANQIGLALGKSLDQQFVKVENPVITYDATLFGNNMVGCYAPSVVNYNKVSGIRLFYTLADAYGHYAYFADFDASNLDEIKIAKAMITNKGDLQSGDTVTMFPNADFAYDSVNARFYAVKDYSPSAATKPNFADEFEVCYLAEEELYTTDLGLGWVSVDYQDYVDLGTARAYSGSIVSDMYGHLLDTIEIIYNDCQEGDDYQFTQYLRSYVVE